MYFRDIKISTKLLVTNLAVVLSLFATALWMEHSVTQTLETANARVDELSRIVRVGKEWKGLSDANVHRSIAAAFSETTQVHDMMAQRYKQHSAEISELQAGLKAQATKPGDAQALAKIAQLREGIHTALAEVDRLHNAKDMNAVELYVEQTLQPALAAYLAGLEEFVQLQEVHRKDAKAAAAAAQSAAEWQSLAVMVVVALAGMAGVLLVSRSILQPMRRAVQVADAIAAGDLTQDVEVDGRRDEIGTLMLALSTMNLKLRQVVSEVRYGVESVNSASADIAAGNVDLSARTEQTAANLEEAAASMEELTGTVSHTADAAGQASKLAASAADAATRGHAAVDNVMARMEEIADSSARIADIIGTIDSISFQTNILALNAAVEAARAGEHGRGFAVVATEVRALANRSADAARQIKALISASADKVSAGSALVARTGDVMADIEMSIKRATSMMGEISAAAQEQRDGIAQVNQSVTHLDEMTQQNAALVEQSVAGASMLREQAAALASLVAMFKVEDGKSERRV